MNNSIPAVEKTLALLERLAASEKGLTQLEFKEELGISMSTCYRILQTLLAHEWVRKDEKGVYCPGKGLFPVLGAFRDSFFPWREISDILDRISRKQEIICKLSIRQGADQLTVLRSEPSGSENLPAFSGKRFSRFPVIEGSVGAVLLAQESRENILLLAENCPVDLQEKSSPQLIFRRIEFLRKHSYALNENNRWHICAFSVPVRETSGGSTAALTFILPRPGLDEKKRKKYVDLLMETGEKCEKTLNEKHHKGKGVLS